jgi:HPt (histidine-containing phosphotransfer) domain-containing protein
MPHSTPPNPALAELLSIIGEANTREIVRTFLHEAPLLLQNLNSTDRPDRHRAAHSLKSSALLVGAEEIAARAAVLEGQLAKPGGQISPAEIRALAKDLVSASPALTEFAGA